MLLFAGFVAVQFRFLFSASAPAGTTFSKYAVQGFGRSCLDRSGGLLQHVSTVETVKDLELLRGLVGDDKINYFGSSYGTRIGAIYAELYPHLAELTREQDEL